MQESEVEFVKHLQCHTDMHLPSKPLVNLSACVTVQKLLSLIAGIPAQPTWHGSHHALSWAMEEGDGTKTVGFPRSQLHRKQSSRDFISLKAYNGKMTSSQTFLADFQYCAMVMRVCQDMTLLLWSDHSFASLCKCAICLPLGSTLCSGQPWGLLCVWGDTALGLRPAMHCPLPANGKVWMSLELWRV